MREYHVREEEDDGERQREIKPLLYGGELAHLLFAVFAVDYFITD
jgi:hypothetical protein